MAVVTIYDKHGVGHEISGMDEYTGTTSTIVDSARNAAGYVVGTVIRDDVGKVSMKWKLCSVEQWSGMLKLFSIAHGGRFSNPVKFFDQVSGAYITREMYVSDRTAKMLYVDSGGAVAGWLDCTFNLTEV
ncbi:MAG: hypothetical protein KH354_05335 [Clostridiales bacterium]|nr:hypothetical protein [Clostridiales bacterium]